MKYLKVKKSPVHYTWIRQILARFTARVLLRPAQPNESVEIAPPVPATPKPNRRGTTKTQAQPFPQLGRFC
jgi:hypothetical protein